MKASVVVPTTTDRGPLLEYSVGSILRQTVTDLEVLVIGDGVYDETRVAIRALQAQDDRVRFFDFPKGARRGEPNRHAVLSTEARGEIVCYLCDRDLMLPHHVETLYGLLQRVGFAHTLLWGITPEGDFYHRHKLRLQKRHHRQYVVSRSSIPLSLVGHRLDMYHRLPYGWRTTPDGIATDAYMWRQFLAVPECRAMSSDVPTILYFKRGSHPGWSTERRREELQHWSARIANPSACEELVREVQDELSSWPVRFHRQANMQLRLHPWLYRILDRMRSAKQAL